MNNVSQDLKNTSKLDEWQKREILHMIKNLALARKRYNEEIDEIVNDALDTLHVIRPCFRQEGGRRNGDG